MRKGLTTKAPACQTADMDRHPGEKDMDLPTIPLDAFGRPLRPAPRFEVPAMAGPVGIIADFDQASIPIRQAALRVAVGLAARP